jgi:hypothetical protein
MAGEERVKRVFTYDGLALNICERALLPIPGRRELARDEASTFTPSSGAYVSNREQAPSHRSTAG